MRRNWWAHYHLIELSWIMVSLGMHLLLMLSGASTFGFESAGVNREGVEVRLLDTLRSGNSAAGGSGQLSSLSEDLLQISDAATDKASDTQISPVAVEAAVARGFVSVGEQRAAQLIAVRVSESGAEGEGAGDVASEKPAMPLAAGNRRPVYPHIARQRGWEGEVLLWVLINPYGEVISGGVEQSSGYASLDRSALQAVRRWRFSPASAGGVFVESRVSVPVSFRLNEN